MKSIFQFFLAIFLLTISCSFASTQSPAEVSQGNVIYSFKSGKMQCQSQIDLDGQLTILLTSLSANTNIHFQELVSKRLRKGQQEYALKAIMLVTNSEPSKLCAGWVNAQEVTIDIYPLPVKEITLTGKKVYSLGQVTVLVSEN
jgi:hypothetical protein